MKTKHSIITTASHGAQTLHVEDPTLDESLPVSSRLYILRDASRLPEDGKQPAEIWMTGEELTSLAQQWLAYAALTEPK